MRIINIQLYNFAQMECQCSALQEDADLPMCKRVSISVEALWYWKNRRKLWSNKSWEFQEKHIYLLSKYVGRKSWQSTSSQQLCQVSAWGNWLKIACFYELDMKFYFFDWKYGFSSGFRDIGFDVFMGIIYYID